MMNPFKNNSSNDRELIAVADMLMTACARIGFYHNIHYLKEYFSDPAIGASERLRKAFIELIDAAKEE